MSERARRLTLLWSGIILIFLGVLHLAATPNISRLITAYSRPKTVDWFAPPMLLNHIVLGILLFPLGILTAYAAAKAAKGLDWAVMVCRTVALTVLTLPVTVFVIMGGR